MTPMPGQKPTREEVIATWDDIIGRKGDKNYKGGDPEDDENPPAKKPEPPKPKQ